VSGEYRAVGDWRPYREHAMAIERALLDEALVERVRALPIEFREQTRVSDVLVERGQAVGVEALDRDGRVARLSATLVIAADGRTSVVAQRVGPRGVPRLRRGLRRPPRLCDPQSSRGRPGEPLRRRAARPRGAVERASRDLLHGADP